MQFSFAQSEEEVLMVVEEPAQVEGGLEVFLEYLHKNLKYPYSPRIHIVGKVFIQFIIEKDGTLSNYQVVKGIEPKRDTAALAIFENYNQDETAPKWAPAQHQGKAVRQKMVIPIHFQW